MILLNRSFGIQRIWAGAKVYTVSYESAMINSVMLMWFWKSLQAKFFIAYSMVLVIIAIAVSIPMYIYLKNNIEQNVMNSVNETVTEAIKRMDDRANDFDNISKQLYLNFDSNGKTALQYLQVLEYNQDSFEMLQASKSVQNFVALNSELYPQINRINIFNFHGNLFSNRPVVVSIDRFFSHADEIPALLHSKGERVIRFKPHDPWLNNDDTPVISFMRLLDPFEHRSAILEVQFKTPDLLPVDKLGSMFGAVLKVSDQKEVLYSSGKNDETPAPGKTYSFRQTSRKTGLTIELSVNRATIFTPLHIFRNVTVAAVLFLILFSMLVFYLLTRLLIHPLMKLKSTIDSIDLDDKQLGIDNTLRMDEIEVINRSFRRMSERLKNSLEEIVRFRTLQLQSHFDTLQAQINPHFLFNILGVIQASAENGELQQVTHVSANLSNFLRYSIATNSPVTTLSKEIEFTERYLSLMQTRYLHRLKYDVAIDSKLHHMLIPKVTLQPLVENCIQHGFRGGTPILSISISGTVNENQWQLRIRDSGSGFQPEEIQDIQKKITNYIDSMNGNLDRQGQGLSIGGMGLVSTFARLHFMFKNQLEFSFGNHEDQGALIDIRGTMNP